MNDSMYLQTIPDSQRYTNIEQLIVTMENLRWKEEITNDDINYVLVGLKNSKADGFNLVKQGDL
jgi:hypothetical protein